ncbi:unannotated protein [freshwater metagenome]|uniref:Unannotated protein n=1 Tax=freshwater metagenome TaxID=449393 RepID=A0A6J7L3R5_9ZZZZ
MPVWSQTRPAVRLTNSAWTAAASGQENASSQPSAAARRARMRQSGSASPGGSIALRMRVTRRSELVVVPAFSGHAAAGRTRSANAVVSVGW